MDRSERNRDSENAEDTVESKKVFNLKIKPDADDTTRHMAPAPGEEPAETEEDTKQEDATAPETTSSEAKASEEDTTTE